MTDTRDIDPESVLTPEEIAELRDGSFAAGRRKRNHPEPEEPETMEDLRLQARIKVAMEAYMEGLRRDTVH